MKAIHSDGSSQPLERAEDGDRRTAASDGAQRVDAMPSHEATPTRSGVEAPPRFPGLEASARPSERASLEPAVRQEVILPEPPPPLPADFSERIEAQRQELARMADAVAAARVALAQGAERIDRMQARLRAVEEMLRSRTDELGRLRAELAVSGDALERERRALEELEAERTRLARAIAELHVAVAERRAQLARQRTRFRIVAFDGTRGTTRRPIVLECRRDAIRFVPENVSLGPEDLNGFTVRFNPLAQAVKALASFWEAWNESHPEPGMEPEPYVLLIVRPSGTVAFYVAQRLLAPTGIPFGYQLVQEDVELDLEPPNPEAVQALQAAILPALQQREKLIAVLARRTRSFGEPLDLGDAERGFTVANPKLGQDAGRSSAPGNTAGVGTPAATGAARPATEAGRGPAGQGIAGSGHRHPESTATGAATARTRPGEPNRLRADASWSRFPRRYGVTPADRFFTSDAFRRRRRGQAAATGPAAKSGPPRPSVAGGDARSEPPTPSGWPRSAEAIPEGPQDEPRRLAGADPVRGGFREDWATRPGPGIASRRPSGWPAVPAAGVPAPAPERSDAASAAIATPERRPGAQRSMAEPAEVARKGPPAASASGADPEVAAGTASPVVVGSAPPAAAPEPGAAVDDPTQTPGQTDTDAVAGGPLGETGTPQDAASATSRIADGRYGRGVPVRGGRHGGDPERATAGGHSSGVAVPPISNGQAAQGSAGEVSGLSPMPPVLRRWGMFRPDAVIGLERPLKISVDVTSLTVEGYPPKRFALPGDPLKWTDFLARTVDRTVLGWGPPPGVFYWVPRLRVTVVPGGQPALQRLQAAAQELRLDVDADMRLAPPDWARSAASENFHDGWHAAGQTAWNAEEPEP